MCVWNANIDVLHMHLACIKTQSRTLYFSSHCNTSASESITVPTLVGRMWCGHISYDVATGTFSYNIHGYNIFCLSSDQLSSNFWFVSSMSSFPHHTHKNSTAWHNTDRQCWKCAHFNSYVSAPDTALE